MPASLNLKLGQTRETVEAVPAPTSYDIEYEDQSSSDAGRVESGRMYKKRKGTIRKASFTWTNLTQGECQIIFKKLQNEYVWVSLYDPFQGGTNLAEYYAGNRKATCRTENNGMWTNISCSLTSRDLVNWQGA